MRSPNQFFRERKQTQLDNVIAEVIRISEGGKVKPRSDEPSSIGIADYRLMAEDDEVSSDLSFKEALMLPTLLTLPADNTDEKAKKAALFIEQVHKRMQGSPLLYYRDMALHEGLVTGFNLLEPIFMDVEIPEFGMVKGIRTMTVANSADFIGSTVLNEWGDVEKFIQKRDGEHDIDPATVAYWGYKAVSGNIEGKKLLYPAYKYWKLKNKVITYLSVFVAVNAAGVRKFKIPSKRFKLEKDDAITLLEELADTGAIAMPDNWDLDLDIPPGTAGMQFVRIIQEVCNKAIRKTILYDDTVTAEGMHSWGEGGKEAQQNMVAEINHSEGEEFCDTFISDQVYRMILDENGMQDYPTPLARNTALSSNADVIPVIDGLSTLRSSGISKIVIPVETQQQIIEKLLNTVDIEYNANLEDVIIDESNSSDNKASPPDDEKQEDEFARAPRGRSKQDTKGLEKKAVKREGEAIKGVSDKWNSLLPDISKKLNNALFNADGSYKTTNPLTIRDVIKSAVKYKGSELREVITEHLVKEWEEGFEEAKKSLRTKAARRFEKIEAGVSTAPRINPQRALQSLKARVYNILDKQYNEIAYDLFYQVEQAILGTKTPIQAQASIEQYLRTSGLQASRASTVLRTALSQAYNGARMSVYSELHDPFGQTPGSIKGYVFSAQMDGTTTVLCQALNDHSFMCNDPGLPMPPLHFGCRSMLIPVFDDEEPWTEKGKKFNEFAQTSELISTNGGIAPGFGGL